MIVLGIDPGTRRIGYAVIKHEKGQVTLLKADLIETVAEARDLILFEIHEKINEVFETYTPSHCAIEKLFFSNNQKTALAVAEARGVLLQVSAAHHCTLMEFTPNEIKSIITGSGTASKPSVARILYSTLKIAPIKGPDDITDAIAIALAGIFQTKNNSRVI
ncbi:MAG: crossover junction endodeoxyribonuclease RuvC [Candidatus Harrisonbacteria bacterium RIFCSPLOWO2_01_FULL_40_28]|uniref:Crossover junction endodeoxyribonuclease RuvC n=2 Tax=Candidatus Harrisoniibacteriota TaxID=1817905 RepID=A0A1G1ZYF9_9BACT|nr:MAG: crossover junction endodeoxyribonuclease RuvC [Candidatus Harrisonbacteria bacterium RIFCSPLOWO2_01_FULL_40_28]OGY69668.1 MAG: crossover junction endodeoxyribonuclease RuvC [Candidatus Harrisonbacteria bacterium RIFOXYD1_FULL_40_9]